NRPASREVVKGHRLRSQHPRVSERVRANQQAKLNSRRDLRPGRKSGPSFEDRLMWVAEDRVQVVPGPQVLVAELLHPLRRRLEELPICALRPKQDAQTQV